MEPIHLLEVPEPAGSRIAVLVTVHPDDESFFHPFLLQQLWLKGWVIHVLYATKGEKGDVSVLGCDIVAANIRPLEAYAALHLVGVKKQNITFMGFVDGELAKQHRQRLVDLVWDYIEAVKAEMLITFDEGGVYGHDDHSVVGRAMQLMVRHKSFSTLRWAFFGAADPTVQDRWRSKISQIFVWPRQPTLGELGLRIEATDELLAVRMQMLKMHASQQADWHLFPMGPGDREAYLVFWLPD